MVIKILILLLLISVVSCGPKKDAQVPVKLKVFKSNLATGASMSGGVVIVGRSEDNLDSFRLAVADATQDITLDLKKGKWEFAAVAWSGGANGFLTGVNRCSGTSMIELKDAEATVNFSLTQARCLSTYSSKNLSFTESSFQNSSGAFFSVKPVLCLSSVLTPANCPAGINPTVFKSFKVLIPMEKKGSVIGNLPELVTTCQTIAAAGAMTLPLGGMVDSSPFGFKVSVYPNATCSGTPKEMDFSSGVIHSVSKDSSKALIPDMTNQWALLIINPGAQAASNSVMVAGGATHTKLNNPQIMYEPLSADIVEVCFKTINSAAACSGPDWRTTLSSPQTVDLGGVEGFKTVYIFGKTSTGATSLIGLDSIVYDTTAPTSNGVGSYNPAYSSSPIALNWPAYSDANGVTEYKVKSCSSTGCTGCGAEVSGLAINSYNWPESTQGMKYICVSAGDAASNYSSFTSVGSFEFDTTPPTVSGLVFSSGTYSNSLSLNYTLSAEAGVVSKCFNESSNGLSCSPWISYSGAGAHILPAGQGPRTVYVHVKDQAGNIGTTSQSIFIDTMTPTQAGVAFVGTYFKASDFPLTVNWGASIDANLDTYQVKVCQSSDCSTTCGSSFGGPGSTVSRSLDVAGYGIVEGLNHVCVEAVDIAMNTSGFVNVATFTKDSIAPSVSGVTLSLKSGDAFTNTLSVPWVVTGSVPDAIMMCVTSSASSTACSASWVAITNSGNFTLSSPNNSNSVYIFYKDAAGNISLSISDSIAHDDVLPGTIALISPSTVTPVDMEGHRVHYNFTGGSDTNFYTYHLKLCDSPTCSGVVYGTLDTTNATGHIDANPASNWALNTDAYLVVKAEDLAGNFSVTASNVSAAMRRVIFSRAQEVALGGQHTCALLTTGQVKCYGLNTSGQLGIGNTTDNFGVTPATMGDSLAAANLGLPAKQIAAGGNTSCALLVDGSVKCWGLGTYGILGQGNTTNSLIPVSVDIGARKAIQISMSSSHACIVSELGEVKCWGANNAGQLGIGSSVTMGISPGQMSGLTFVNLGVNKAVKVAAGEDFTCALLSDRTVKCWGANTSGQLGQGNTTGVGVSNASEVSGLTAVDLDSQPVRDIVTGHSHACALLVNGDMKCWGRNTYGALGNGSVVNIGDGPGEMGSTLPAINVMSGKKVIQMSAGNDTSCALLDGGQAKCWGNGGYALLAQNLTSPSTNTTPSSLNPIDLGAGKLIRFLSMGVQNACAIMDSGELQCWGQSGHGGGHSTIIGSGLGGDGQMGNSIIGKFIRLGYATKIDVMKIATGNAHNCVLLYNGKIKCWGKNDYGQLGNWQISGNIGWQPSHMGENLPYVDFGEIYFKDIASGGVGSDSTCALDLAGNLRCWGSNLRQQLGVANGGANDVIGDNNGEVSSTMPPMMFAGNAKMRSIEMGGEMSCALGVDGLAYCFGDNMFGQLGKDVNSSLDMAGSSSIITNVIQLSLGQGHACALYSEGKVKCWGLNANGQLGQGHTNNIGTSGMTLASTVNINISTKKAIKVDAGKDTTCALLDDHTVKCWGKNDYGVLGIDTLVDLSHTSSPTIYSSSQVNFHASNSYALDIQVGGEAACVLKADGQVRCWGDNRNGQLGMNSNTEHYGSSVYPISTVLPAALSTFAPARSLSMGMNGCVISGGGAALCWGDNTNGQAGQGSNAAEFGTAAQFIPAAAINL